MPKGIFTQCVAVLLEAPVSIDAVAERVEAIEGLQPRGRRDADDNVWLGGEGVLGAFDVDRNGLILVDVLDAPWPDGMGNPRTEVDLFGAWTLGHLGPFAYPGGLDRATRQVWTCPEAKELAPRHRAFLRVRSSWVIGAGDEARVTPAGYDPRAELAAVTDVARELLSLPGALLLWNPSGEVLADASAVGESLFHAAENDSVPLDLYANARIFNLTREGWVLLDTVGMAQLEVPDLEAVFVKSGRVDPGEVDAFLRNVSLHHLAAGATVIADGETADGPGGQLWTAARVEEGLADPPRAVIRWRPVDGPEPPKGLLDLPE